MKLLFGILILVGAHLQVEGESFEFVGRNGTCILLDIDATFNLTYTDGNETEIADMFDLNGATVVNRSSLCGDSLFKSNSVLTVRLFPSTEELQFTFQRQFGEIRMRVALFLNPEKHFRNMSKTSPIEMKDYMDLHVGGVSTSNCSYECHSEQDLLFLFNNPFHMTMAISNIQAQAYNITNDTFGPAIECDQDPTTTSNNPISTEPSNVTITTEIMPETTTVVPENTTTHVPTSESPIPTTTEPSVESTTYPHAETSMSTAQTTTHPAPSVPKFVVKNKDIVCIVLEGNLTFEINYQKKDDTVGTARVSVPYNADVEGNCHLNNTAQEISLTFFDPAWVVDIIIMKGSLAVGEKKLSADGNAYTWKKLKLSFTVDDHFVDAKKPGTPEIVEIYGAFESLKGNTDGSYKCKTQQIFNVGNDVKLQLSKMQYRAFGNTKSADFTNKGVLECAADSNNDGGTNNSKLGIILGSVFGGLAVIILAVGVIWYYRKRKGQEYESL